MSKDIETMINEAPVLILDPFSTTELPWRAPMQCLQRWRKKT